MQVEFIKKESLKGYDKLMYFSSSGVKELLSLLEREGLANRPASPVSWSGSTEDVSNNNKKTNLTAIVFVEQRQAALVLDNVRMRYCKLRVVQDLSLRFADIATKEWMCAVVSAFQLFP